MKRTLVIALGTPAVAALFLLAGGSPAANAGEQHHPRSAALGQQSAAERAKHHHCTTAKRCRPKPLPKPANGWPCAKTHSCGQKHHYPICKPPVTPPPVIHPKPKPHHPTSHVVGHRTPPVASRTPDQLPRTGSNVLELVLTAGGLIGGGVGFKRLSKVGA